LARKWVEFEKQYGLDLAVNIFAKEDEETKKLNADLREKNQQSEKNQQRDHGEAIAPLKK